MFVPRSKPWKNYSNSSLNCSLVSAGFDAYKNDPITQMTLERDDFATFGKWLADVKIPTAAILEGGYSDDLPELIDAFLEQLGFLIGTQTFRLCAIAGAHRRDGALPFSGV